ncbi:Esterase OS=Streptomyces microflavus OX=1919 GN=Smic_81720 PE=4 SV=1 [Streptomyces microflavus]
MAHPNDVLPDLRADGHAVHPLTLSGLADKQGVAAAATHVDDIVDYVERLDLHDVVLVGHSYSGIPAGQGGRNASVQPLRSPQPRRTFISPAFPEVAPGAPWLPPLADVAGVACP